MIRNNNAFFFNLKSLPNVVNPAFPCILVGPDTDNYWKRNHRSVCICYAHTIVVLLMPASHFTTLSSDVNCTLCLHAICWHTPGFRTIARETKQKLSKTSSSTNCWNRRLNEALRRSKLKQWDETSTQFKYTWNHTFVRASAVKDIFLAVAFFCLLTSWLPWLRFFFLSWVRNYDCKRFDNLEFCIWRVKNIRWSLSAVSARNTWQLVQKSKMLKLI